MHHLDIETLFDLNLSTLYDHPSILSLHSNPSIQSNMQNGFFSLIFTLKVLLHQSTYQWLCIVLQVVRSRISYPGSPDSDFEALEAKQIVEHNSCEPQCKIKPHNCNPQQIYIARECRCMCRSRNRCPTDRHVWDEETCLCKCAQRNDNCPGFSHFSDSTCR